MSGTDVQLIVVGICILALLSVILGSRRIRKLITHSFIQTLSGRGGTQMEQFTIGSRATNVEYIELDDNTSA